MSCSFRKFGLRSLIIDVAGQLTTRSRQENTLDKSGLQKPCPYCGTLLTVYANPVPAVDVIIATAEGVIFVCRKNPPRAWALPGGFIPFATRVFARNALPRPLAFDHERILNDFLAIECQTPPLLGHPEFSAIVMKTSHAL